VSRKDILESALVVTGSVVFGLAVAALVVLGLTAAGVR
jgi:hypothetical protein